MMRGFPIQEECNQTSINKRDIRHTEGPEAVFIPFGLCRTNLTVSKNRQQSVVWKEQTAFLDANRLASFA